MSRQTYRREQGRQKARRGPMLNPQERRAVRELSEEKKRSWRWFSETPLPHQFNSAPLPDALGITLVVPSDFGVQGANPTPGTLTLREEAIQAKDIRIICGWPMLAGSDDVEGVSAFFRVPTASIATLVAQTTQGESLRNNPRYVWGVRPFQIHGSTAGATSSFQRSWKRVTVGLGTTFGLLVEVQRFGGSPSAEPRKMVQTYSYLYSEAGLDVKVA